MACGAEAPIQFDDAPGYARFMGRWSRAAGAVFLEWLAPPRQARWLDVGCGTGVFTKLILETCDPRSVTAVDPSAAQIRHASRQMGRLATVRIAATQDLPFAAAEFDVVAAALVLNFIVDRPRAVSEMRRVTRAGGLIAGYVWNFAAELSPSWPLRCAMRRLGIAAPEVAGTRESHPGPLKALFEQAGLEDIATRSIDVSVGFASFGEFWAAQRAACNPITPAIAALTKGERQRLAEAVRRNLPHDANGRIEYSARAVAIKARCPPSSRIR